MSAPKISKMEPLRLAKKLAKIWARTGEANVIERKVLRAMGDICTMQDAECRKNPATIHQEYDISPRNLKYGIYGRKRRNRSEMFPGLLARGVLFIKHPRDGRATVYGMNLALMRQLCGENLCTPDVQPVHGYTGTSEVPDKVPEGGTTKQNQKNINVLASPFRSADARPGDAGEGNPNTKGGGHKTGGQEKTISDDVLENYIVRVKTIVQGGGPIFSEKSREKLRELIPVIEAGGFEPEDFEVAVRSVDSSCADNEKGYAFFGTTLVNNLLSDMRANKMQREKAALIKKQTAQRQAKQKKVS
jgi:hypothetical protein